MDRLFDTKLFFRALRHRNYRLFFGGQGISLIGTWMQQVALSWLVYHRTNSALLLGVVSFAGQIPAFLLTPLAGVIADRHNRHRILVGTQTLSMIQAFILSVLVLTNSIAIWHIVALSIFLGMVNSLDIPLRHAFVIEMIEDKQDLGNAIALNSSLFNIARLIGPSLAGIIIALFGEGICFLLNAISYLAVIISLLAMKITPRMIKPSGNHIFHELKEGFIYTFSFLPIRYLIVMLGLASLMGAPYQILMPVFARDIFHGGPKTLGFLMAMAGLGALMGAIYLAGKKNVIGFSKIITSASGFFGAALIVIAVSKVFWFSLLVICAAGFAMMVQMAASNTIVQTIVDEGMRGRVMSFYTMAFIGTAPFGSLLSGTVADRIGAPNTLLIGGGCCIIGALIFAIKLPLLRQKIRPIYVEKGIIPEVAKGIEATSD